MRLHVAPRIIKTGILLLWAITPFLTMGQSTPSSPSMSIEDFAKERQQEEATRKKVEASKATIEKQNTINIYSVLFATNSATLTEKDKNSLIKEVIPVILRFPPTADITIEGHTDDTGNPKINLTLSQKRADSVMTFLVSQGIDGSRLTARGFGEYRPLVRAKTEAARTQNRRVSLIIDDPGSTTIVKTNGEVIAARNVYLDPDGTISYRKSVTDPIIKIKRTEVKVLKYQGGDVLEPNKGIMGTIQLKNGQEIPARMIAREPGFISYKKTETDPIIKLKVDEVRSVQYADGSVYKPGGGGPGLTTDTSPSSQTTGKGLVVLRDRKKIKAFDIKESGSGISYKVLNTNAINEKTKSDLYYVVFDDGRVKPYNLPTFNFNFWDKLPHLTRFSPFINLGVVPLNVKEASINFAYVDESPSKDNMQSIIQLQKRFIGYGGQIGAEGEIDSTIIWRGYYQFAMNSEGATNALGFGIGKVLGKKKNKRIGADLQFGSAYVKLGDVYQNDLFIQVNDTRFYSNSVSVRYRNYFAAIHPYFSIEKSLKKSNSTPEKSWKNNVSLRLNLGVAAGLHTRSLITFKGEDGDSKSAKASEKLTASNVAFNVNGAKSTNARLFSILGPQVSVAVYYSLLNR